MATDEPTPGRTPSPEKRPYAPATDGDLPLMDLPTNVVEWLAAKDTAGRINAWKCDQCGKVTVCRDLHTGVTPMFLACRRTEGCQGTGASAGYPPGPIPPWITEHLAWEWYRPSQVERKRIEKKARQRSVFTGEMTPEAQREAATLSHIDQGGLLLRPIEKGSSTVTTPARVPSKKGSGT